VEKGGTQGEEENCREGRDRKSRRDHLEDLGIDGKTVLNGCLRNGWSGR